MSLRIRRIDSPQDFMALAPLWSKLAGESGQLSPFLSYDWFWCCWHAVWPQMRPEILLVEDAKSPVAIIPLMRWKGRLRGLPVRYLGFLGYPNAPMVDLLTVVEHRVVLQIFLDHLRCRSDWDVVWLQKLPSRSPTLQALEAILPERFLWRRDGSLLSPHLAVKGEWESFYSARYPSFGSTPQRIQEQLEHSGDVRLEEHRVVDPGSLFFRQAIDLIRWSPSRHGTVHGILMPRLREFFSELTRRASKNGWLSLWLLRLDDQVMAMQYQLLSDGKVQVLWADEQPRYRNLSPGIALQHAILKALFERGGVQEYSLGPEGKDGQLWWVTGYHETVHLKLYRPSLYPHLLSWLEPDSVQGVSR